MKTLDLSFSEPALNLACDEVLLDEVNSGTREPTLRFWESPSLFVVVGYGNDIERECHTQVCQSWASRFYAGPAAGAPCCRVQVA